MSLELKTVLHGTGDVRKEDGTAIGKRRYRLEFWADISTQGGFGREVSRVEGLTEIRGVVLPEGTEVDELQGEHLEIVLEDGRVLPFFYTDERRAIAARGLCVRSGRSRIGFTIVSAAWRADLSRSRARGRAGRQLAPADALPTLSAGPAPGAPGGADGRGRLVPGGMHHMREAVPDRSEGRRLSAGARLVLAQALPRLSPGASGASTPMSATPKQA
jgi:hypothetical protein